MVGGRWSVVGGRWSVVGGRQKGQNMNKPIQTVTAKVKRSLSNYVAPQLTTAASNAVVKAIRPYLRAKKPTKPPGKAPFMPLAFMRLHAAAKKKDFEGFCTQLGKLNKFKFNRRTKRQFTTLVKKCMRLFE